MQDASVISSLKDWEKCSAHTETDNLNKGINLLENIFGWKYTEFGGLGVRRDLRVICW